MVAGSPPVAERAESEASAKTPKWDCPRGQTALALCRGALDRVAKSGAPKFRHAAKDRSPRGVDPPGQPRIRGGPLHMSRKTLVRALPMAAVVALALPAAAMADTWD